MHVATNFPYLSQLDQKLSHVVSEICMCFPKQHDLLSKPQNLFSTFTMCGFKMTCWTLCGVETTRVCGFKICLFLLDRTAWINTTEVLTCQGSFGGFETTCYQLDRAASFETTGISYFSCNRSVRLDFFSHQNANVTFYFREICRYLHSIARHFRHAVTHCPLLLYPHYVVTFVFFLLLLVYLNLVSLSERAQEIEWKNTELTTSWKI